MSLSGSSVVVLSFPNYQELEFWYPVLRAREEGADVFVVGSSDETCESYLGYPVLGDRRPEDLVPEDVDALVVPGAVGGTPNLSPAQIAIIRAVHAAGRPVFASGTGVDALRDAGLAIGADRVAVDADGLPALLASLRALLAH